MHPILQRVESQFHSVLGPLDFDETQVHPDGNALRWNTQQVVEHLILTYQLTSYALEKRLEKRRPTSAKCTPLEWWLQLIVLKPWKDAQRSTCSVGNSTRSLSTP